MGLNLALRAVTRRRHALFLEVVLTGQPFSCAAYHLAGYIGVQQGVATIRQMRGAADPRMFA
jgi:hypothetical protein